MSKQNKVNPGMYTQRGRLTQDDAARELAKMRQVGSQHTWQPTKKNELPRLESKNHADGTETTEDNGSTGETSAEVETRRPSPVAKKKAATKKAPVKAKAKTAQKAAKTVKAKKTTGKAKKSSSVKTAATRTATKPKRKAVLARNVGGGGATPRPTAKRRKS